MKLESSLNQSSEIIQQVREAVQQWPRFATATGVSTETARRINRVIAGLLVR